MTFLKKERKTLEQFLPGLDAELEKIPLSVMESRGNPALQLFREHGGTALLVPTIYGGAGVSPLQIIQIQRALGSRSPSLAIATNMHSCTVAAIPPCQVTADLLQAVVQHKLYLASGFADGQTNTSVLSPKMQAERVPGGWRLTGSKKPCSLSESMDFLTASVLLPSLSGEGQALALAMIPAKSPGMEVRPFTELGILAGAETHEVILNQVEVPDEYMSYFGNSDALNIAISKAFFSFELLVSASYLGVASALVERVLAGGCGSAPERTLLAIEVEGAMASLEGVALSSMLGCEDADAVAKSLFVRYSVQRAIERVAAHATELLGGLAFFSSNEIANLFAASRALAFHPPSRLSIAYSLDQYLLGEPLVIP